MEFNPRQFTQISVKNNLKVLFKESNEQNCEIVGGNLEKVANFCKNSLNSRATFFKFVNKTSKTLKKKSYLALILILLM